MRTVIIYPAYFFSGYSRKYGRRVSRALSFNSDLQKIERALQALGIKYTIVSKRYSRDPWKFDKALEVDTDLPKSELIFNIAKKVKELHNTP